MKLCKRFFIHKINKGMKKANKQTNKKYRGEMLRALTGQRQLTMSFKPVCDRVFFQNDGS